MTKRKIIMILSFMWLLLIPVSAAGTILTVDLGEYGEMLLDAKLTLYQVAEEKPEEIVLVGDFTGSGVSLTQENLPYAAELLADFARERNLIGEDRRIGRTGAVRYEGLEPGIYLVMQHEKTPDDLTIIPFLIHIGPDQAELTAYPKVTAPSVILEAPDLPQTGQISWPIPVLLGLGLVILLAGSYLHLKNSPDTDK